VPTAIKAYGAARGRQARSRVAALVPVKQSINGWRTHAVITQ